MPMPKDPIRDLILAVKSSLIHYEYENGSITSEQLATLVLAMVRVLGKRYTYDIAGGGHGWDRHHQITIWDED